MILNASGGDYEDQRQLAREARALWQSHVLITSGASLVPGKLVEYDSFVFLTKPFLREELLAGVAIALKA